MAASSMKAIKTRMSSINSTKQITNAMQLVASSKLRKAKKAAEESQEYFDTMYKAIVEISMNTKNVNNEFLNERPLNKRCHIVIAGDRGLAGGYNSNVFKEIDKFIEFTEDCAITIGKKAHDYFMKRKINIIDEIESVEKHTYEEVKKITDKIMELYLNKEIDEVLLTYTQFNSAISQEVKIRKILPLVFDEPIRYKGDKNKLKAKDPDFISEEMVHDYDKDEIEEVLDIDLNKNNKNSRARVKYLPSAKSVLEFLIPTYISGMINGAIVESYASEQGARRTAMESATDNANEMIKSLELSYNRARQSTVTQEITEISAGVEAQK